jgi:hypothetical protein
MLLLRRNGHHSNKGGDDAANGRPARLGNAFLLPHLPDTVGVVLFSSVQKKRRKSKIKGGVDLVFVRVRAATRRNRLSGNRSEVVSFKLGHYLSRTTLDEWSQSRLSWGDAVA